mmetsp:Transcript_156/g.644  ORF Transcript_156/g.644 Transcript_156/m.644 type:complete len:266 (-) Transcript_156:358-1155(-)
MTAIRGCCRGYRLGCPSCTSPCCPLRTKGPRSGLSCHSRECQLAWSKFPVATSPRWLSCRHPPYQLRSATRLAPALLVRHPRRWRSAVHRASMCAWTSTSRPLQRSPPAVVASARARGAQRCECSATSKVPIPTPCRAQLRMSSTLSTDSTAGSLRRQLRRRIEQGEHQRLRDARHAPDARAPPQQLSRRVHSPIGGLCLALPASRRRKAIGRWPPSSRCESLQWSRAGLSARGGDRRGGGLRLLLRSPRPLKAMKARLWLHLCS